MSKQITGHRSGKEVLTVLSNVIMCAVCLVVGGAFVFAYRLGLRDGMRAKGGQEPAAVVQVKGRVKQSKEDKKYEAILSNIDSYDGSGIGQREVN